MVCKEIEFLRGVALNAIVSPRKDKYYITVKKDDELVKKVKEFFGNRFAGYREAFKGRSYLIEVNGVECDELKKLAELGAVNITVAMKKPMVSIIVTSKDSIEKIKKEFEVVSVKDAIKGVNYSVKIKL